MRGIIHWDPPRRARAESPPALTNLLDWGVREVLLAAPPAALVELQNHLADKSGEANCAYALLPEQADPAVALFAAMEFCSGLPSLLMCGMRCFACGDWTPEAPRRGMHVFVSGAEPVLHSFAPTGLQPLLDMHRAGESLSLQRLTAVWEARGQLRRVVLPAGMMPASEGGN